MRAATSPAVSPLSSVHVRVVSVTTGLDHHLDRALSAALNHARPHWRTRSRSNCPDARGARKIRLPPGHRFVHLLSNNHAVRLSSQVQDLQMGSSRPSRDRFTDILKGWAWRSAAETAQRRGLGTAARNQRLTLRAELRRPGSGGCQADRGNWVCHDTALHAKSRSRARRPENLTYPAE